MSKLLIILLIVMLTAGCAEFEEHDGELTEERLEYLHEFCEEMFEYQDSYLTVIELRSRHADEIVDVMKESGSAVEELGDKELAEVFIYLQMAGVDFYTYLDTDEYSHFVRGRGHYNMAKEKFEELGEE